MPTRVLLSLKIHVKVKVTHAVRRPMTCCTPSANEHPPKADTDNETRVPMLGLQSKHVLPAAPERPCIGPNDPASNSTLACAPKPPDSSLGSHPAERPPRVLLTSTSSTLPQVAPAPKLRIEGSLSPMRMRSSTRDSTCAHIPRCESCKRWLQKKLKPTSCSLIAWGV